MGGEETGRRTFRSILAEFRDLRIVYLRHAIAVFRPGRSAPVIKSTDRNETADISGWSDADVAILLEEGRRAHDASVADLGDIRSKAQVAFTTGLVLLGAITAQLAKVHHHHHVAGWVLLSIAALLAMAALAGTLAILVVQVSAPTIHPALLTTYAPPIARTLALDYAENAIDWKRLNSTQRTVLREALLYLTLAGIVAAALWIYQH